MLVRLRFVPRDPALITKLASKLLPRTASKTGGVELLDWFVDDELNELYIMVRGSESSVEQFVDEFSASLRGEGVWVSPLPTGTLGSWLAPVKPSPPGVLSEVVAKGHSLRPRLVYPDGSVEPLSKAEVVRCLLLSGVDLNDAESALSEALDMFRGRNVVSVGELADALVRVLASQFKAPARILAAVKASLCPHAYVMVENKGRLTPITKAVLEKEAAELLKRLNLRPLPGFLRRVASRAYDKLRLEAISLSASILFRGHPPKALRTRDIRALVSNEAIKEAPLLQDIAAKGSPCQVAQEELKTAHELAKRALRETMIAHKLETAVSAVSRATCALALLKRILPTSDASEVAEYLGEEEVAELLRRAYALKDPIEAGDVASLLASKACELVNDAAGHVQEDEPESEAGDSS